MSPFDQTIRAFLSDASSSAPTPGGGSVAALIAALGASMTSMVANVTRKKVTGPLNEELGDLVAQLQMAMSRFEELLTSDVEAFTAYMTAFKMPKHDEQEKAERQTALQAAVMGATKVPMDLAQTCLDTLVTTCNSIDSANQLVLSDLGIAVMLLETAGLSALLTAEFNIPFLHDELSRTEITVRCEQLDWELRRLRDEGMRSIKQRMNSN